MADWKRTTVAVAAAVLLAGPAAAAPIAWTDWQTIGSDAVTGQITVGSTVINVTYDGPYNSFATQV